MANDLKQMQAVFFEVLAAQPAERTSVLDRACAGNAELRQRVEQLLRAYKDSEELPGMRQPSAVTSEYTPGPHDPSEAATIPPDLSKGRLAGPSVDGVGSLIAGRYTLTQLLGEGGMGEVWIAQQSEPVKRQVALKLIKTGMDSKTVLQRFEQERQALALMDHPNIAKVLDGGMTSAGQPFFVMELVHGQPLTRFCDEKKLTPRERLELFVPICQAVQHAHQKGVVHRDLKPANILVTVVDGKPVPKVIDFGVAKATATKLTDETMATQIGAVIGTLEYMSPEQASGEDIDTRADIYSMGVILYELLTGLRPIDAARLKKAALLEMIMVLVEEEPSKPSTRLSTADSLPSLAALRQTEPKKLMAMLRGELDWVVMKCLEKQRERRYETANGLARDIQRYLADETVEARPPSTGYRLNKFIRRNRGAVIAASLVTLALLAGFIGTALGMVRAERAREDEEVQRKKAEDNERRANDSAIEERKAKESAEKRLVQVKKGIDFLGSIFTDLGSDTAANKEKPLKAVLGERLDKVSLGLEGEVVGDPLDVAQLQMILARSQLGLQNNEQAISLISKVEKTFSRLLGNNTPQVFEARGMLATGYLQAGKYDQATMQLVELLEQEKAVLGESHPQFRDTLNTLAAAYSVSGKYDQSIPLMETALKLARVDPGMENPLTIRIIHNLAATYQKAGKVQKALPLHEEAVRLRSKVLGEKHQETLVAKLSLAGAYADAGETAKAIPLFEETYRQLQATAGPMHADTLRTLNNLVKLYLEKGKYETATPLMEQALTSLKLKLGPDHPDTLTTMANLAQAYRSTKRNDLALPLAEESYQRRKATLGAEHPDTLSAMNSLAAIYLAMEKREEALPLLHAALKAAKARLGADHPDTFPMANNLGAYYFQSGRFKEAVAIFEDLLERMRGKLGENHPDTFFAAFNLAVNYSFAGQVTEAEKIINDWLPRCRAKLSDAHPTTKLGLNNAARVQEAAGHPEKAEAFRRSRVEEARRGAGAGSTQLANVLTFFCMNLNMQKKYAEAEPLARECLAIREKREPNNWQVFNAKSILGESLLGQKLPEAEQLLLAGYEGMKQREKTIPSTAKSRLPETLDRLIQFYTETNKPDEVEKWQAEKAKLPKPAEKKN